MSKVNLRKILKILIKLALILFAVSFLCFIADSYYYKYDQDMHFNNGSPPFLNDKAREEVTAEWAYGDRFGDSIFYISTIKQNEMLIWKLAQWDGALISHLEFEKNAALIAKLKDGEFAHFLNNTSIIALSWMTKMKSPKNLRVTVDANSQIDTAITAVRFIYLSLNFNQIVLYDSDCLNIMLSKIQTQSNANFMLYDFKGTFYLILLYPLDNSKIKPDLLLSMVNLKAH